MSTPQQPIAQIGLVVTDLDAAIRRWHTTVGLGPWTVYRNVSMQTEYRGRPGVVTIDVGLAQQAETQIELIQPTNDGPSPYRDDDGRAREGLHHLAWLSDDLDATLKEVTANGLKLVFRAESPGTRVAYVEQENEPGLLFEYIESPQNREQIAAAVEAARSWDGREPITTTIDLATVGN